jgi:histidine phosphotransferase ChpT
MPEYTLDLNGLLGARLCHDLISPVGAIRNGMELLELSGNSNGPELELIRESASNADSKLRYFRVAFGMYASEQVLAASEIRELVCCYVHDSAFEVDWKLSDTLPRPIVKTLLLCLLCLETLVQRSGQIIVTQAAGEISLTAYPKRILAQRHLTEALKTQAWPPDLTAAQVHFPLAAQAINTCQLVPALRWEDTKVTLTLSSMEQEQEQDFMPASLRHQLQDT